MAQVDLHKTGRSPPYSCYVTPAAAHAQAAMAELNGPGEQGPPGQMFGDPQTPELRQFLGSGVK